MFGESQSFDLLATRASTTPQKTAIIDTETGDRWSYRELHDAVDETARALSPYEQAKTNRLGIAVSPSAQFVVALYAAIRLGWQVVPLNDSLSTGELGERIERVEPAVCLCTAETETLIAEAVQSETAIVSVDEPTTAHADRLFETTGSVDPDPPAFDETILILFTSGTTGDPKAVQLTAGNILASATASAFRLGVRPDYRWLCCLPMYHMGGLAPAFRTVLYGTTLAIQPTFDAAETARIMAEQQITGVSLVPTQLKRLLDAGIDAPTLETVLLGGAPASKSLIDRASDEEIPVYPTYGLTETASQVATATPQEAIDCEGTVGHPLLGTSVTVVDDGKQVSPGQRGEIVVDGPTVTPGYLDEEKTKEAFCEWGLQTGDLGYRDDDGRLWVIGRRDDTIITGGELVSPAEIVEQIERVRGVTGAAVVGVDDLEWGQRVVAVVSGDHESSTEETRARILDHCREQLANYKVPKKIEFVETIPRTHSGTVDRGKVHSLLE